MSATNNQIAANRANSAHSTGPSSPAGKAASSKNAISHGLLAASVSVFNWESEADLHQLRNDYLVRFLPIDRAERDLVDRLVDSTWRRNRIVSIETSLLEIEIERMDSTVAATYNESESGLLRLALAFRERNGDRVWDTVLRYLTQTERSYHRAMRELQTLQGDRFNQQQLHQPAPAEMMVVAATAITATSANAAEESSATAPAAPMSKAASKKIHVVTERSQNPQELTPATPSKPAEKRDPIEGNDLNGPSEPGSAM